MNLWEAGRGRCTGLTSLVIPVYNQWAFTEACLGSLRAHTRAEHEIIVIDNASSDETPARLAELSNGAGLTVISNEQNFGFTLAANQGMRAAAGDFVVLLNNDTEVTEGWLEGLLAVAQSDDRIGIVAPKLVRPDSGLLQGIGGLVFCKGGMRAPIGEGMAPDAPGLQHPFEIQYAEGSCMLISRAVIEAIGLLDESYAPAYYEDTDYCFRAREAGFRIVYSPYSTVFHHSTVTAQAVRAEDRAFAEAPHRNDRIFRERWTHRFW